jgi:hypothetical protein
MTRFDSGDEYLKDLLFNSGASPDCYVISEDSDWDGKYFLLEKAIERCFGLGLGMVISCIPGKLGYYQGEEGGGRMSDGYGTKSH